MEKKSRITAILLSVMMAFAMVPLSAGAVFADDNNEAADSGATLVLEPGSIGGDPVEINSNDEGAMAASEEEAANGQFYLKDGELYCKLPDQPSAFDAPDGIEFKGWIFYNMIQWFRKAGEIASFEQTTDTVTVTAVWGPVGTDIESWYDLEFEYNDEEQTATIIGYGAGNFDFNPVIAIPNFIQPGSSSKEFMITGIGDYAFQYIDTLYGSSPLLLTKYLKVIGDYACYHAGFLDSVAIPDDVGESQLERIGDYAFAKCSNLTSVEIPASVKTIGEGAFADCDNLQSALFLGTEEQWQKVSVGAGNEKLTSVLRFPTQINDVLLSKTQYTYNGKIQKPSIETINGEKLTEGTDYTAEWSNESSKGVDTYTVTVTGKGNYIGTAEATYTILPKKAGISKAAPGKKLVKVTMSSKVAATGGTVYQIQYRVKGTSKWKTTTAKTKTKTIKKLKKGKKYQIKVRAYKSVSGTAYCGAWSKVKTTKKVK